MILDNGHWAKTQYLLERGMDVAVQRRNVIADNIANADTPHFKRSEISFESELNRALDSEKAVAKNMVPARTTNERHIPFFRAKDYRDVNPRTNIDYLSTMRNDGNNVDPEHEVNEAVKTQMLYQAMATRINGNFRMMNIVLRTV